MSSGQHTVLTGVPVVFFIVLIIYCVLCFIISREDCCCTIMIAPKSKLDIFQQCVLVSQTVQFCISTVDVMESVMAT